MPPTKRAATYIYVDQSFARTTLHAPCGIGEGRGSLDGCRVPERRRRSQEGTPGEGILVTRKALLPFAVRTDSQGEMTFPLTKQRPINLSKWKVRRLLLMTEEAELMTQKRTFALPAFPGCPAFAALEQSAWLSRITSVARQAKDGFSVSQTKEKKLDPFLLRANSAACRARTFD